MKKLLYFLLALPLLSLVSCGDDDTPDVNVNFQFSNATVVDGTIYVVQGDSLGIDSLWVVPVDTKQTASVIGNGVVYSVNGYPVARGFFPNFAVKFPTDSMAAGKYDLGALFNVAETGCAIAVCAVDLDMQVVADSTAIPTGGVKDGQISVHRHD